MVTIFKTIKDVNTPFVVDVMYVLNQIKDGKVKQQIELIRKESKKQDRNILKEKLPAICFSGEFKRRAKGGLINHSGFICLDFDNFINIDELQVARKKIIETEYTYACFISPSGDGLKVLIKIPVCNAIEHEQYYLGACELFSIDNIDSSTKDVSRVCYASYDPNIYINEKSILFTEKVIDEQKHISEFTPTLKLNNSKSIIEKLQIWFNKKYIVAPGTRNNNLFIFAAAMNDFGVSKHDAESYLFQYSQQGFSEKEITTIINSAYKNTANFGTKFFEDNENIYYIKKLANQGINKSTILKRVSEKHIPEEVVDTIIDEINTDTFWIKSDKGKVKLVHHKFRQWLTQNGFSKYYPEHSDNFVFIYKENNLIDNTTESKIKDYVLEYLQKLDDISIYELMVEKTTYFRDSYLNFLENVNIEFKEDTEDTAYIYFKNGTIQVNKKESKLIDYVDLDGFIWKKHIINKDFTKVDYTGCDFQKFVFNISGCDQQKEKSIKSTIGYLLHSYKNSATNYAVILNDEMISENPNGGTGKGILINAISKMKRCAVIDGKTFSFDKSFPYQTVGVDTHNIVFDDVIRNFPFEKIFSIITEGITLEKKNKDAIKIPVEKSPKIIISTNYAIGGEGSSFERRKWEIELAQHYNVKNTPLKEFGRLLFDQWDDAEWMRFYNYMIDCLQLYLSEGLVKVEFTNTKLRQFIASTCTEFNEWINEGQVSINERTSKKEMYDKFISEFPDKKTIHVKTFNKWVKAYANYKELIYTDGNSNGVRWFCISESDAVITDNLKTDDDLPF